MAIIKFSFPKGGCIEEVFMTPFVGPRIPVIYKIALGFLAFSLLGATLYISIVNLRGHSPSPIWGVVMLVLGILIVQITFAGKTRLKQLKTLINRWKVSK